MSEVLSLYRGLLTPPRPRPLPRQIIAEVACRHGMTVDELLGANRKRPFVRARWEAMTELRQRTTLSLPAIGHFLGGMDHTTVLHGLRRHAELSGEGA